jgi:hypothetical protein
MRGKWVTAFAAVLLPLAGLVASPAAAQRVADQAKDPGFAPNAEMAPRPDVIGRVSVADGLVTIEPAVEFDRAGLTVKRIGEGIVFTRNYPAGGVLTYAMVDDAGRALGDGQYGYEFVLLRSPIRNAKGEISRAFPPMTMNGSFEIRDGALVLPKRGEGGGAGKLDRVTAPSLSKITAPDITVADDLIVEGSTCSSALDACADGEDFTEGDLVTHEFKIKGDPSSIWFDDTSGDFDWAIGTNGNNLEFHSLAGTDSNPFVMEGNAPDNAIYIDSTGAIGFGTATPATALHVLSGKNVFMRIQDTTALETWDFGTNSGGDFAFILQATNSGGATGTKFVIEPSGEVGIGTASPVGNLHIFGPADQDVFNAVGPIPAIGGNALNFGYSGSTFGVGSGFFNVRPEGVAPNPALYFATGDVDRMMIDNQGFIGVHLDGALGAGFNPVHPIQSQTSGAHLTAGGIWTNASSRDLKEGIAPLDADAALQALAKLEPVNFHYKLEPEDPHVGFISEEVPELVATPDRKTLSPMDIVAVLTRVVQEQQRTVEEQQRTIATLAQRVGELESKPE